MITLTEDGVYLGKGWVTWGRNGVYLGKEWRLPGEIMEYIWEEDAVYLER